MPALLIRGVEYRGEIMDLLVNGTAITRASGEIAADVQVIDARGLVAIPDLRDRHVHFRDPGLTEKEDLLTGARAAAAGGYCTVICEPNTRPVIDTVEKVQAFYARVAELKIPISVRTKAALTVGQQGEKLTELYWMCRKTPVAGFSDDGEPVLDKRLLAQAFRDLSIGAMKMLSVHCEETPRSAERARNLFGPSAPLMRETQILQLSLDALREANTAPAWLHVQHVSQAESVRLLAAPRKAGLLVTAEVTPHHLLLCEDDIPQRDANWKMNPPLRSRADMLAMRRALADGVLTEIATDHAPHTPMEKAHSWDEAPFGVIGLETAFGACMSLVHAGELSFARLVAAMTFDDDILAPRRVSDGITLVDLQKEWTVDPTTFYSKARNCPFAGRTFKGKPVYTIANGRLAMADNEVLF